MRLLISYLKEKLPMLGVYAVTLVIFLILFWLKAVPFDVIWYGAEPVSYTHLTLPTIA